MILILVASAFALSETQSSDENELCNYIIQKSNIPVGTKLPGIFMQYKNDNFNVYTPEGDAIGHLAISNGYVAEFDCNLIEKPNYYVNLFFNSKPKRYCSKISLGSMLFIICP